MLCDCVLLGIGFVCLIVDLVGYFGQFGSKLWCFVLDLGFVVLVCLGAVYLADFTVWV